MENRLTFIRETNRNKFNQPCGIYQCSCGNITKPIAIRHVNMNKTRSCGCLRKELMSKRTKRHGKFGSRVYNTWCGMIQRCLNPNHTMFKRYGGRGIKICELWYDFNNFYKDMGERPDKHSLDRINNNGDYFKENCRWATQKQQSQNKNFKTITHNNQTLTTKQWAEKIGITHECLITRLKRKWPIEKALK